MTAKSVLKYRLNNGQLNEETVADHENLFDQYQSLEHTLQELRDEFSRFPESNAVI